MTDYENGAPPMRPHKTTLRAAYRKAPPRVDKYQVNHARTSGGPKFTSLSEALHYIRYCMREGSSNDTMIISKIV